MDASERVVDTGARAPDAATPRSSGGSRVSGIDAADGGRRPWPSEPSAPLGRSSDEETGIEPEPQVAQVDQVDLGESSFSLTDPLDVSLELANDDWHALRREGRSLPATISGCDDAAFPGYTDFGAQLRLAGAAESVEVQVRKKGYIGSISMFRLSLVVDFSAGVVIASFKRLTLNNNREDPTNAHQCMAYELYTRAGLRAPRCGLARVAVNGDNIGYFTNACSRHSACPTIS